ncbi:MAG: hypothetical protein M3512_16165 [Bacteroidota bacterium]|nr:hypothetical protein [Bacteroidota bacterium]
MNYPGLESPIIAGILILLAVALPVFVIFMVMKFFRKKRERGREKASGSTLKSVKQERLEEQEGKPHD